MLTAVDIFRTYDQASKLAQTEGRWLVGYRTAYAMSQLFSGQWPWRFDLLLGLPVDICLGEGLWLLDPPDA